MNISRFLSPLWKCSIAPLIALLICLTAKFLTAPISDTIEHLWLDRLLRFRAAEHQVDLNASGKSITRKLGWGFATPLDERIRFVELNLDESLAQRFAKDGEFAVIAQGLETIAKLGPRVIAVDILFSFGLTADQQLLADAIRRINDEGLTQVVVPIELNGRNEIIYSLPNANGESLLAGFVNLEIDEDRIWRHYRLTRKHGDSTLPSMALAAFSASLPTALPVEAIADQPGVMRWQTLSAGGDLLVREVDDTSFLLNLQHSYFNGDYDRNSGVGRRIWTLPDLETLADNDTENSPLRDAIVFVGYGAAADGKPTAIGPMEPGMLLHATALQNLLHGDGLHRFPTSVDWLFVTLVAVFAALSFFVARGRMLLIGTGLIGLLVIFAVGGILVWVYHRVPPTVGMTLVWSLSFTVETARRWNMEQRERVQRDSMLGFYFSPAVLRQVLKDINMIRPRGGEMAVLLSDMRGFTSCCETMSPEQVFELLNRLFEVETEAALVERGSLRPFAGDQFLAYWGAPEPCNDSADRALRAAIEICRQLDARRARAGADSLDELLQIGIGLHFGAGLVGHVGSRQYRDYNVLGDLVNTAARVESQTKNYHAKILVTEEFVAALNGPAELICLDYLRLKGRHRPVRLFGVLLELNDTIRAEREIYDRAFRLYEQGEFSAAGDIFSTLQNSSYEMLSASSRLMTARCGELPSESGASWSGIYEAKQK